MKKNYDTHGMSLEEIKQRTEEAKKMYAELEKMLNESNLIVSALKKEKNNKLR